MKPRRVIFWIEQPEIDDDHLGALRLARWFAAGTGVSVEVVVAHDGPLLGAFSEVADVLLLDDLNRWRVARLASALGWSRVSQVIKGLRLRWWMVRRRSADLAIGVGIGGGTLIAETPLAPSSVLVQLEGVDDTDRAATQLPSGLGPLAIVTHSATVAGESHRVPIVVVESPGLCEGRPTPTRASIGVGAGDVLVGAAGATRWWEEPEQFVLWAWLLEQRRSGLPVRTLWLTDASERQVWPLQHDIDLAGIDGASVVNRPDFLDVIPLLDVLVVSGRGRSASLLADAALRSGVAVIATDNLEGIDNFDGVVIVPYLEVHRLVDAVFEAIATPARPDPRGVEPASLTSPLAAVERLMSTG